MCPWELANYIVTAFTLVLGLSAGVVYTFLKLASTEKVHSIIPTDSYRNEDIAVKPRPVFAVDIGPGGLSLPAISIPLDMQPTNAAGNAPGNKTSTTLLCGRCTWNLEGCSCTTVRGWRLAMSEQEDLQSPPQSLCVEPLITGRTAALTGSIYLPRLKCTHCDLLASSQLAQHPNAYGLPGLTNLNARERMRAEAIDVCQLSLQATYLIYMVKSSGSTCVH
ncbi:hypothetical protein BDN67DRAFT_1053525 [Paxillus ammoniavirescens]|nr:hypothetical protein BDN67DRAFT_1053525 [Paxillus ammoniavirescens]